MFAGIIEGVGTVAAIRPEETPQGRVVRLEIDLGALREGLSPGASVAVNGVCLTLTRAEGSVAAFEVIPETLRMTNLGDLQLGDDANLERSLRVGDRIDGHFVQGHIDGCGTVTRVERQGEWRLWLSVPESLSPFMIRKGSVTLDGVSLTIADVRDDELCVALIPTTLGRTTLGRRAAGDRINIETDVLARIVIARLDALTADSGRLPPQHSAVDLELLRSAGFVE